MSDPDAKYLEVFGTWLRSLADDVRALAEVLSAQEHPETMRRPVAAALNYLFKSLDLIDDGIEGLGFVDDAIVMRVVVSRVPADALEGEGAPAILAKLTSQVDLIRDFLGEDYARLEAFVDGLLQLSVRGRSVSDVLADPRVCEELVGDVVAWANRYETPSLGQDGKNAVKLRAFLSAKLGSGAGPAQ